MHARFGYIPVASPLGKEVQAQIVEAYAPQLTHLGGERWAAEQITTDLPLFYFVVTGGTERTILNLQRERRDPLSPVLLIAHPGNNSLPAALEVLARLQQEGTRGRILYLHGPRDETGFRAIAEALWDVEVWRTLRQARMGMVGPPSDWLVASMPDPDVVRRQWGPAVIPVELEEVVREMEVASMEEIAPIRERLASGATAVREPSLGDLENSIRVYLALKRIVTRYRLDVLTVRCFDLVVQLQTTGCFALAQLIDDGIIAGCEGDLVSTVGMFWAYKLLGEVPWMANPAQVDEAGNTLWLAHCTVARRLVRTYRLRSHFESGLGVGIQGELPAGPVTLLRVGGRMMERLWLAEGELLRAGDAENLCRTQAEVRLTAGGTVSDLLRSPLGNHLVLVPGRHMARLHDWWTMMLKAKEW